MCQLALQSLTATQPPNAAAPKPGDADTKHGASTRPQQSTSAPVSPAKAGPAGKNGASATAAPNSASDTKNAPNSGSESTAAQPSNSATPTQGKKKKNKKKKKAVNAAQQHPADHKAATLTKRTLEELQTAARQGNAEAQCALGLRHFMADSVPKDFKKAFELWTAAAAQ